MSPWAIGIISYFVVGIVCLVIGLVHIWQNAPHPDSALADKYGVEVATTLFMGLFLWPIAVLVNLFGFLGFWVCESRHRKD